MTMLASLQQPDITEITVRAVDQIGETAAADLERAADAHERKAKSDADKMRQLALTIRDQCKQASAHIEAFCQRSTDVMSTIKELSARVGPKPKAIVAGDDDGKPIPSFLEQGPVVGNGVART